MEFNFVGGFRNRIRVSELFYYLLVMFLRWFFLGLLIFLVLFLGKDCICWWFGVGLVCMEIVSV